VEHVIQLVHDRVTLIIAESKNVLQGDANVGQVFLDIGPAIIFLVKLLLMVQVVGKFTCALLQP
jgi:hypothetical protein